MIPKDVIKQLVGDTTALDYIDDMATMCSGCSKFQGKECAIFFDKGIVEVYNNGVVEQQFAIKATLEQIDQ